MMNNSNFNASSKITTPGLVKKASKDNNKAQPTPGINTKTGVTQQSNSTSSKPSSSSSTSNNSSKASYPPRTTSKSFDRPTESQQTTTPAKTSASSKSTPAKTTTSSKANNTTATQMTSMNAPSIKDAVKGTVNSSKTSDSMATEKNTTTIATNASSAAPHTVKPDDFYVHEHYGLTSLAERGQPDVEARYVKALCSAIGSGNEYTAAQVEWIKGLLAAKDTGASIVANVDAWLKESSNLMDLELALKGKELINTDELRQEQAPRLVYDMYRASAVEDFPDQQLCAIAMMAAEWPIGQEVGKLENLKNLVEEEEKLKRERVKTLFPDGHPYLNQGLEQPVQVRQ